MDRSARLLFTFFGMLLFTLFTLSAHAEVATLYGPVTDQSATQVIAQIQQANKDEPNGQPIILFIDSPGGSITAGWRIIDAMAASRKPVWTVCVSLCASMAAIEFEYGAQRGILPHAVLMFHHESGGAEGSAEQILAQGTVMRRQIVEIEEHIAKLARMPVREFREKETAQWWLLADDAIKAHLADIILVFEQYPLPEAQK